MVKTSRSARSSAAKAPVVVDVRTRVSRQLVLEDGRYDPSYRVCQVPQPMAAGT